MASKSYAITTLTPTDKVLKLYSAHPLQPSIVMPAKIFQTFQDCLQIQSDSLMCPPLFKVVGPVFCRLTRKHVEKKCLVSSRGRHPLTQLQIYRISEIASARGLHLGIYTNNQRPRQSFNSNHYSIDIKAVQVHQWPAHALRVELLTHADWYSFRYVMSISLHI